MTFSSLVVRRPVAVLAISLAILGLGLFGWNWLPTNLLPEITYPMVKVYITWRGATPAEIETDISDPVERQMATVDDLDYLESTCSEGLYQLTVNFRYNADRDAAYQDVLAKIGLITRRLPRDAESPIVFKADPSQLPVVDLLVSSKTLNLVELRRWADNDLQDQFVTIPGTAGTDVVGGQVREIRVHLDPERLESHGISADHVVRRLSDENIELAAGRITGRHREFTLRTVGRFQSVEDIGSVILRTDPSGGSLFLRDVARVEDLHQVQRVQTMLNGHEGVKLSIFKQAGANVVEVSDGIRRKMDEMLASLPPGVQMEVTYDQGEYVRAAVKGVQEAALIAAILVMLVTAFFLTGWQRVLTVSLTLPVSLLGTFFVMSLAGFSVNLFTLGGLVVAITVLLDNCVVVLENITRLQIQHPEEKNPVQAGVREVSGAVTAATLTFLALFLPFLMVSGLTALLFRELVVTVATVLVFSLLVALTLTPTLIARFFPEGAPVVESHGLLPRLSGAAMEGLLRLYRPLLRWTLKHPWPVISVAVLLFALGVALLFRTGFEFLPEMEDGLITAAVRMPTGTPVEVTDRVLEQIEKAVGKDPSVQHLSRLSGGWVWGLMTYEVAERGQVDIQLVPRNQRSQDTPAHVARLQAIIRKAVQVPGARISVRHAKLRGLRQVGQNDVEVEIRGTRGSSLAEIMGFASKVRERLMEIPGLTNHDVSLEMNKPEYQIQVDRAQAAFLGLRVSQIASTVRTMVDGQVATSFLEEGTNYDVRVMVDDRNWVAREAVEDVLLFPENRPAIRLHDVARVVAEVGPVQIDRKDQARLVKVTADALGRTSGEVNRDAAARLADLTPPAGCSWELGGQATMIGQEFTSLGLALVLAVFLAYVVLAVQFESFVQPFLITIRIPLSLIGVGLALYLTNVPIGATAFIGIVVLAGVEVNHGVVLLAAAKEFRERGLGPREAIEQAGILRLRPILMTALVGIVGMVPLALGLHEGTELLKPMAIAVMGGLTFSMFLTLQFLPALYVVFFREPSPAAKFQEPER